MAEGGSTLSSGQRQLLSFAQALAFNPEVLVLDEATSSIDTETEQLIQDTIAKLMHDRTSIVIAHRLSTIRSADRKSSCYTTARCANAASTTSSFNRAASTRAYTSSTTVAQRHGNRLNLSVFPFVSFGTAFDEIFYGIDNLIARNARLTHLRRVLALYAARTACPWPSL